MLGYPFWHGCDRGQALEVTGGITLGREPYVDMKRREFIGLLGGAAAWPLAARAQQPAMPVVGFLSSRSPGESHSLVAALRQGLRETGFVEGQNLVIAFRWAEGRYDQLPTLAAELVDLRVAVLVVAGGTPPARAAKAATSTIPVVFSAVGDPVGSRLVASLNRPGGNLTRMSVFSPALIVKRLELLKDLMPGAASIAYLAKPSNPNAEPELRRQRRVRWGFDFTSSTPTRKATSTRQSRLWKSCRPKGSSSRLIPSSIAAETASWHSLHGVDWLRATAGANTSWPAD
jgi:ABC transporter substrate binding protein